MKKTIISTMLAIAAISAAAQTVEDGLSYSQNDYFGTARSIAMGNAFTALGGDAGSVGINPAGSAVNNYSQFTITPGVNMSFTSTAFNAAGNVDLSGTTTGSVNASRFVMPNFSSIVTFETGNRSRVKRFSFGISGNATGYLNESEYAGGINGQSSMMSSIAAVANSSGITSSELNNAYFSDLYVDLWPAKIGYNTALINPTEDGKSFYPTAAGGLYDFEQVYTRESRGSKYDWVINFGLDYEDFLYFGANLGLVTYERKLSQYFDEAPTSAVPVVLDGKSDSFLSGWLGSHLNISGSGIYGKFGVIYVPSPQFRLGAAIQTPTAMYIRESLWYEGGADFNSATYAEAVDNYDEYYARYKVVSPMRVNLGLAYNFGAGVISVDYEAANYGSMRFKSDNNNTSSWSDLNSEITSYLGVENQLRVGAEYKINPAFAVRAGYNLRTSPYKGSNTATNIISGGLGYSSNGSFFCDFACRFAMLPTRYYYPYSSYDSVESPETSFKTNLLSLVATLGWRF